MALLGDHSVYVPTKFGGGRLNIFTPNLEGVNSAVTLGIGPHF